MNKNVTLIYFMNILLIKTNFDQTINLSHEITHETLFKEKHN